MYFPRKMDSDKRVLMVLVLVFRTGRKGKKWVGRPLDRLYFV